MTKKPQSKSLNISVLSDKALEAALEMWLSFYHCLKKKDVRLLKAQKNAHSFSVKLSKLKDTSGDDFAIDFPRTEKLLNSIYKQFRSTE